MKKKIYLAIIVILVSHLALSSCECPFAEYLKENTEEVKYADEDDSGLSYQNDKFYFEDLYGHWQCYYPFTINVTLDFGNGELGEIDFKEIKFCDDGYADVYMQKKYDTDKRPYTLTYGIKKYNKKHYLVFGDEYGTIFKALPINGYIWPELTVDSYKLRKTVAAASIDKFHALDFLVVWTCPSGMTVGLPVDLGSGMLNEVEFQRIEITDYYHAKIKMRSLDSGQNYEYDFNYVYKDFNYIKFYREDSDGREFAIDFGVNTKNFSNSNSVTFTCTQGTYNITKSK